MTSDSERCSLAALAFAAAHVYSSTLTTEVVTITDQVIQRRWPQLEASINDTGRTAA